MRVAEERAARAETRCTQLAREAEALREELAAARRRVSDVRRQAPPRELRLAVRSCVQLWEPRCFGSQPRARPIGWYFVSGIARATTANMSAAVQSMHARTAPAALAAMQSQEYAQNQALAESGVLSSVPPP